MSKTNKQPHLLIAEHDRPVLRLLFQPQEPLMDPRKIVPEPEPVHARVTHVHAPEAQLARDALRAPSGPFQAQSQYLLLDLRSPAVRRRAFRRTFFLHWGGASGFQGPTHVVERVAVIAHDMAGLRYAAEFFDELKQQQFAFRSFCSVAREFHLYLQVLPLQASDELEPVGRLGVVHVKAPVVSALMPTLPAPVHLNHAREYAQLQPGAKLRRRYAGRRLGEHMQVSETDAGGIPPEDAPGGTLPPVRRVHLPGHARRTPRNAPAQRRNIDVPAPLELLE